MNVLHNQLFFINSVVQTKIPLSSYFCLSCWINSLNLNNKTKELYGKCLIFKFGVSFSNSLTPPTVQICTYIFDYILYTVWSTNITHSFVIISGPMDMVLMTHARFYHDSPMHCGKMSSLIACLLVWHPFWKLSFRPKQLWNKPFFFIIFIASRWRCLQPAQGLSGLGCDKPNFIVL